MVIFKIQCTPAMVVLGGTGIHTTGSVGLILSGGNGTVTPNVGIGAEGLIVSAGTNWDSSRTVSAISTIGDIRIINGLLYGTATNAQHSQSSDSVMGYVNISNNTQWTGVKSTITSNFVKQSYRFCFNYGFDQGTVFFVATGRSSSDCTVAWITYNTQPGNYSTAWSCITSTNTFCFTTSTYAPGDILNLRLCKVILWIGGQGKPFNKLMCSRWGLVIQLILV